MKKRPHMPLAVKLEAAIRQLGFDPADVEFDHTPALELRTVEHYPVNGKVVCKYVPDANDPRFIVLRTKADHSRKTNGPGGEKRITSRGGDHGDAAHLRAVTRKEAEFRARLLAKAEAPEGFTAIKPTTFGKRKIASRGFDKRKRPSRG